MEEKNYYEELARIQLERSKKWAEEFDKNWKGLNENRTSNAGSYTDATTPSPIQGSSLKESSKNKFSLGLNNTLRAIKNSAAYEIPGLAIVVESYFASLNNKLIDESVLYVPFIKDLTNFSWDNRIKGILENCKSNLEKYSREIEISKAIYQIKNSPGRDLYESLVDSLNEWVNEDVKNTDKLIKNINKWTFNPVVRELVKSLAVLENRNGDRFQIAKDNTVSDVIGLYVPVLVKENYTIFYANGTFFKIDESLSLVSPEKIEKIKGGKSFLESVSVLSDPHISISEDRITLINKSMRVEYMLDESERVFVNGKEIKDKNNLGLAISVMMKDNLFTYDVPFVNKAVKVYEAMSYLAEINWGKKIKSTLYEGLEINILKYKDKIYLHKINPAMALNSVTECSAKKAVQTIKDLMKFDISESLTEFLTGEEAIKSVLHNDRNEILSNINKIEGLITKIDSKLPGVYGEGRESLIEAKEELENEISILRSKWNEINVMIEGLENKETGVEGSVYNTVDIKTPVKILSTGNNGVVIGKNDFSKSYTVMLENGQSGEYFYSDVIGIGEEAEEMELSEANAHNLSIAPGNSSKKMKKDMKVVNRMKKSLFAAPSHKAPSGKPFIDDHKKTNMATLDIKSTGKAKETTGTGDHKMSKLPKVMKKGEFKKFISDPKKMNLAEAPGSSAKSGSKFIDKEKNANLANLLEQKANKHTEKAPQGKKIKSAKFIEKEKNANLAKAPGSKKKSKEMFVEPLKRANLASAPKGRSKKIK